MAQAAITPANAMPFKEKHEVEAAASPLPSAIQKKYDEERAKRLRSEGISQFVDFYALEKLKRFKQDPWVTKHPTGVSRATATEDNQCEILIIGAGYSGLLYAVRLLQAGFKREDIRITDSADGFGGTWYWNRYPGLKCDIESYIYMPLLEETNYMPTEKYCSGRELQEHADRIAKQYDLVDRAWFRRTVTKMEWNEGAKDWTTTYTQPGADGSESEAVTQSMRSRFVVLTTGFTLIPHAPQIPGIEKFQGDIFHTARWDYECTGGSPDNPALTELKDKNVGVIGTGATSIQIVPALVEWSKKLYVFQRTPSSVDRRDNCKTDPDWWRREHSKPGWQQARRENFTAFLSNISPKPAIDLVGDGWTSMLSYSALIGSPDAAKAVTQHSGSSSVAAHAAALHALDLPRQERIRQRVEDTVTDPAVAAKLKPWYAGWCKRPCFHDEYLQSFNSPNVTLVDTDGKGVDRITENSLFAGGKEYKIDVLILSTGYRSPFLYSPGGRVNIDIKGRNSTDLDNKWMTSVTTLHGMMSHDFPNICWPGLSQAGGTPNFIHCMDLSAQHVSEILAKARQQTEQNTGSSSPYKYNFIIEPTEEGEEQWSQDIASMAGVFAATAGCTPSYINAEGEMDREVSQEVQNTRARGALWGKGFANFVEVLSEWRLRGVLTGLEICQAT